MIEMSVREIGENLAKIAASSGTGSTHTRLLLGRAQTSLDRLEASIRYNISRDISGYGEFDDALLKVIEQYKRDKPFVTDVLKYVCLTTE